MAFSTNDLADKLAEAHKLTKSQAKAIVEDVLKGISQAAAKGDEVSLNGFGKFKVRDKPAREGRKSFDRRDDQDRDVQEACLSARQGAERCRQRLTVRIPERGAASMARHPQCQDC